ncbi:MAG: hypothetical protein ACOX9C_02765 [Kiritimatiellia bacterium]|jgi:drug/metabolite transporter (DMT)-like permease
MFTALLFLISTGLSWIVVGAAVGLIGRRGLNLLYYQILYAFCGIIMSVALAVYDPSKLIPPAGISTSTWCWTLIGSFSNGFFNYLMIRLMGTAMKRGPNAIVWATIQSGFIYPFLMGWLIFGVPMNACRITGIILIVTSIFLYAARGKARSAQNVTGAQQRATDSSEPVAAWLIPSLLGMLCCGINQCGANLASYLPRGQEFPSAFRNLVSIFGALVGCSLGLAWQHIEGTRLRRPTWRDLRTTAIFAAAVMSVSFTSNVFLMYPGLDILESLGRGPMGYPIMVCSCVIGFFPYGIFVLKERINPIQALGVVVGIVGIVLVSTPA